MFTKITSSEALKDKTFSFLTISTLPMIVIATLILGGTSQLVYGYKIVLYCLSLCVIFKACVFPKKPIKLASLNLPLILGATLLLLHILYVIPLPSSLWTMLPGRTFIIEAYEITGDALPWAPLSMTPLVTKLAILDFIPLIAITLVALQAPRRALKLTLTSIIIFSAFSVSLGVFQVLTKADLLYLYKITNEGQAVGFFSNVNHHATFLAMVLPLTLYRASHSRNMLKLIQSPYLALSILLMIGIVFCGSQAGYLLMALSLIMGSLIAWHKHVTPLWYMLALTVFVGTAIADFALFSGAGFQSLFAEPSERSYSRLFVFKQTWLAIEQFGLWGTGPGSFEAIYKLVEDRDKLNNIFIPQTHNDYLQIPLELGLCGLILMIVFLAWLVKATYENFKNNEKTRYRLFIIILILCLPLIHSIVDYPLRTPAIAGFYTLLLCLYARLSVRGQPQLSL